MKLWIRSQDRERLGTIDRIEYDFDDYGHYLKGWQDKYTGSKIATYKTKERALEVLDDIQRYINNSCKRFIDTGVYHTSKYEYRVYEMPKE